MFRQSLHIRRQRRQPFANSRRAVGLAASRDHGTAIDAKIGRSRHHRFIPAAMARQAKHDAAIVVILADIVQRGQNVQTLPLKRQKIRPKALNECRVGADPVRQREPGRGGDHKRRAKAGDVDLRPLERQCDQS